VAIISSSANRMDALKSNIDYRAGVNRWMQVLSSLGLPYRIVGDHELEHGLKPASMIIVHQAERLTDGQVRTLRTFRDTGGALILTGMTGRYAPTGELRPRSLAEEWLDLEEPRPMLPAVQRSSFFTLLSSCPMSLSADPGYRFELN